MAKSGIYFTWRGWEMALLLVNKTEARTQTPRTGNGDIPAISYIVVTYRVTVPGRLQNILYLFRLFHSTCFWVMPEYELNPMSTEVFRMLRWLLVVMYKILWSRITVCNTVSVSTAVPLTFNST